MEKYHYGTLPLAINPTPSALATPPSHLLLLVIFWPLTAIVLAFDSQAVRAIGIHGQLFSNLMAPLYMLLLLPALQPRQRTMLLVFLPVAIGGEYVFSLVFHLYTYADGGVPFYVPFGHAILFGTGLIFSGLPWVVAHTRQLRWALLAVHASLLGGAIFALGDTLTAVFTLVLVLILYHSRVRLFYLVMGIPVLYVELVGTAFGCWFWHPEPAAGLLHAVNPPVGAFSCYVLADILVMRITRRIAPVLDRVPVPFIPATRDE
jgi:hypothetical protein